MLEEVIVKEEIVSPVDSLSELIFDRFDVEIDNRKLSCSSNDSSLSSIASSTDSGYGASYFSTDQNKSGRDKYDPEGVASTVVQRNLELHLSVVQKENILAIVKSVEKLSDTEKLLLYLKLPTRDQEQPVTLSNTKQEQTQAFQWIRKNLEECDGSINLPKQEVYEQYRTNCESQGSVRYLSAPDFGKIVKCMFPNVKARRLGTRGNSRYCYNGLRKKQLQESPVLPDITIDPATTKEEVCETSTSKVDIDNADQALAAACVVVCEWANKLLGRFFTTLVELAKFLVSGSYVSTKSMAAFTVMSATQDKIEQLNQRFSLEALVKSATKGGVGNCNSNGAKGRKSISTLVKTTATTTTTTATKIHTKNISSPALSIQIVPYTPTKNDNNSLSNRDQIKKVQSSSFVYTQEDLSLQDVLLEDVDSIINNDRDNSTARLEFLPQQSLNLSQSTPKKDKKKKPSPISTQKANECFYPNTSPASAPPAVVETPKKIGRPRVKKMNSSPYPQQTQRQSFANVMSPIFLHNPSTNIMRSTANRNRHDFTMPVTSPIDNELHNIFANSQMSFGHQLPDLQRCHSVPVRQQSMQSDVYQPLTPQIQNGVGNATSMRTNYKVKRDLTSLFTDQNNRKKIFNQNTTDHLVPASYSVDGNHSGNVHYYDTNRIEEKELNNFQNMDDLEYMLPDLSNADELLEDISSNLPAVDGDELLKSLRNDENIWENEWS